MRTYANAAASYTAFGNLPRYALEAFMATFLVIFTLAYLYFNPNGGSTITSVLAIFALAAVRMLPCIITVLGSVGNLRYAGHSLDRMYLDLKELSKLPAYSPPGQPLNPLPRCDAQLLKQQSVSLHIRVACGEQLFAIKDRIGTG